MSFESFVGVQLKARELRSWLRRLFCLYFLGRLALVFLFNSFSLNLAYADKLKPQLSNLPPLMLWTWEARQDLRDIDPKTTGIALLILTIDFNQEQIVYYARQQPLHYPPKTYLTAVVHIANPPKHLLLTKDIAHFWALKIKNAYLRGSYRELQIDFDALTSQRPFYKELLWALHKELGAEVPLSITALASWCTSDPWLDKTNLPIRYVVPMFFSLDRNRAQRSRFIKAFDPHHLASYCQGPIGLTTNKDWVVPIKTRQPLFIYNTGSWTKSSLAKAYVLQQAHQLEDN